MKKYFEIIRRKTWAAGRWVAEKALKKEPGVDGILVTVGLCIIALLLCAVMKERLITFINTLVQDMTLKAQQILSGVS